MPPPLTVGGLQMMFFLSETVHIVVHEKLVPWLNHGFLGRPKGGLMFYPWCIFFFSPRVLRSAPSTDRHETLPHDRNLGVFYNPTPKIRGGGAPTPPPPPPKKLGAKNMPNFGQFWTISDFDREYLRNEATYPKRKNVRTRKIPPTFDEKSPVNFGPLTAWNYMWVWTH